MTTNRQGIDDAGSIEGADFTPEELAAIEQMQRDHPDATGEEGGAPAAPEAAPSPRPPERQEVSDDDDLVEGEEEITIDGQGRGHGKDGQFVSKSALLRVKEQNKQQRAALEAERAARAKLEGRFEILAEALNAQPAGEEKAAGKTAPANPWDEPDIDLVADIFGAVEQQKRRNLYEKQQREAAASSQGSRERQMAAVNAYVADAKRVAAENIRNGEMVTLGDGESARQVPAFQAAYLHVVDMRHAQLEALGIADKIQRDARIAEEERQLIEEAIAAKRSPAEMILALAKASGFRMPTKGAANGSGQQKTQKQLDAEAHLEMVAGGMRSNQSLSGKGGQPGTGVSAQQLINMDDGELASLIAKMGEEKFAKLYLGAE